MVVYVVLNAVGQFLFATPSRGAADVYVSNAPTDLFVHPYDLTAGRWLNAPTPYLPGRICRNTVVVA